MWYFSWILGLGLALTFGVLNALWYELPDLDGDEGGSGDSLVEQPPKQSE